MSNPETEVFRLTDTAFRTLINETDQRPELWEDPRTDFAAVLAAHGIGEFLEPADVRAIDPIHMEPAPAGNPRLADRQALDFYQNLRGMTPAKASDPNLWAWFNHFPLHKYGISRWPRRQTAHPSGHAKLHWLTETSSNIYESSIAGRTWWLADTCLKAERGGGGTFQASEVITLFSEMAERYHYAMRFGFMRNSLMTSEYVKGLLNEVQGLSSRGIRALVQRLNHKAGVLLLDSLNSEQCRHLIVSTAESVMTESQNVTDRSYLKGVQPLKVLSLGAGTQSTVMALMAEQGYAGMSKPDLAIFADTGWEPSEVYEHLQWLKSQLSFEVVTVTAGNIREDILRGQNPRGHSFLNIPTYLTMPDGRAGISKRQCTSDYKLDPIRKELRARLGLQAGRRAPKNVQVEMWLGISRDEPERMRSSRDEWITNRWPLNERGYSRAQLFQWFQERFPERALPRSACIGCPYHGDSEWKHLKEHDPKSFQDAVHVDRALRQLPPLMDLSKGQAFLHRSRIPLEEVNFERVQDYADAMLEECDGLCGI